jgi:iron(III) transport system substrate-binding protein
MTKRTSIPFRVLWPYLAGLVLLLFPPPTLWGTEPLTTLPEKINKLPPVERERLLVEGAKREAEVMWYANWAGDELDKITRGFKKKYPFLNVLIFRGVSGKVEDKVTIEYRAGKHLVDILIAGTSKMFNFKEAGILGRYVSPEISRIPPRLYDKEGWWTSLATSPALIGSNTELVSDQEAPGEWRDLLQPRWKGKVGLDTEPDIMILGLLQAWGEEKTRQFTRALAQNRPQIRSGHTLLTQLLAAGEFPVAAELYGYRVAEFISKGAPLRMSYPNPTIFTLSPLMVASHPAHPYAAALLYDYLISDEGQTIIGVDIGRTPVRRGIKSRNPEFAQVQDSAKFLPLDPWLVGKRTNEVHQWIKEDLLLRK